MNDLDELRRRLRAQGEVCVLQRRRTALAAILGGLVVLAFSAFAVVGALHATTGGRVGGAVVVLLFTPAGLWSLVAGVRGLVQPAVVVRIATDGVEVPGWPPVRWEHVLDVGIVRTASVSYAVLAVSSGQATQIAARVSLTAWANRALRGPDVIPLRGGSGISASNLAQLVGDAWESAIQR